MNICYDKEIENALYYGSLYWTAASFKLIFTHTYRGNFTATECIKVYILKYKFPDFFKTIDVRTKSA